MEDRKSVRLNSSHPSPYLRDNVDLLLGTNNRMHSGLDVIDIGCGNGRNSEYMKGLGCNVLPLDMKDDYGIRCVFGKDMLPAPDNSYDIVLMNYILMFLDMKEMWHLLSEVNRVSRVGGRAMVEMYAAKNSMTPTDASVFERMPMIKEMLGWKIVREERMRFVAVRG
jgi:SAM-dependent methyltransferase